MKVDTMQKIEIDVATGEKRVVDFSPEEIIVYAALAAASHQPPPPEPPQKTLAELEAQLNALAAQIAAMK